MRGSTARAGVVVVALLVGTFAAGCERGYRQVVIVDGGQAEWVTIGAEPAESSREVWAPGRVLVVRSDGNIPGAPTKVAGTAGRVYRVSDNLEMEEIGEFDLTLPNDTLAYRFGR